MHWNVLLAPISDVQKVQGHFVVVHVTGWLLISVTGHHLQPGLNLLKRPRAMSQTKLHTTGFSETRLN